MKKVIQIAAADDAKAWALLQRHSPGVALPNRVFVVSEEAAEALRQEGIQFTCSTKGMASGSTEHSLYRNRTAFRESEKRK